eukprot:scaffold38_cov415-Prasinococcus_capsulatus_cf.AAC.9
MVGSTECNSTLLLLANQPVCRSHVPLDDELSPRCSERRNGNQVWSPSLLAEAKLPNTYSGGWPGFAPHFGSLSVR